VTALQAPADPRDHSSEVDGRVGPWARRILIANIVTQSGIVVTGAAVRLTGSGLGCPTWPECVDGSLVPTASQIEGWTKLVEFGNRTLTFLVGVVALAALIAVVRLRPRRPPLIALATISFLGVPGQAVLGGITVLTGLNPWSVGGHFLLSTVLIAASVALQQRADEPGDQPVRPLVRRELRVWAWLIVSLAFLVVVLGVVTTGTGPHSGDADVRTRIPLDPQAMSWLHADSVIALLALTAGLLLTLRLLDGPSRARRRVALLLGIGLAQGLVGYLQYFLGVPEAAVALHVLGSVLVWIAAVRIPYALRARGPAVADQYGSSGSMATAANSSAR
jgi:cytochrome c oxidase assembly protein subunit 15